MVYDGTGEAWDNGYFRMLLPDVQMFQILIRFDILALGNMWSLLVDIHIDFCRDHYTGEKFEVGRPLISHSITF